MTQLWMAVLVTSAAYGQGSIAGRAVDDVAFKPIEGMRLMLSGEQASATATSDSNGSFRFEGVSRGWYRLTGDKDGYATLDPMNVSHAGNTTELGDVVFTVKRIISGTVRWSDG